MSSSDSGYAWHRAAFLFFHSATRLLPLLPCFLCCSTAAQSDNWRRLSCTGIVCRAVRSHDCTLSRSLATCFCARMPVVLPCHHCDITLWTCMTRSATTLCHHRTAQTTCAMQAALTSTYLGHSTCCLWRRLQTSQTTCNTELVNIHGGAYDMLLL